MKPQRWHDCGILTLCLLLPSCLTRMLWDDLTSGTTVEAVERQVTVELQVEELLLRLEDPGPSVSIAYRERNEPIPQVLRSYARDGRGWFNLYDEGSPEPVIELLAGRLPLQADTCSLFISHDPRTGTDRVWGAHLRLSGVAPVERFGRVLTPSDLEELQSSGNLVMPVQLPQLLQGCLASTDTYPWPTLMGLGYDEYVLHALAWLDGGELLDPALAVDAIWMEPSGDGLGVVEIVESLGDLSLVVRAVSRGEDAETVYLVLNADTLWLSNSIALDVAEDGIFWAHHSSWSVTATRDAPRSRMIRAIRIPAMDIEFATREVFVTKKTDATNYIVAGLLTPITLAVDIATVVFWVWLFAELDGDDLLDFL